MKSFIHILFSTNWNSGDELSNSYHKYNEIKKLISSKTKLDIIADSRYHHTREFMSNVKTKVYKYPCIHHLKKNNVLSLKYSKLSLNI